MSSIESHCSVQREEQANSGNLVVPVGDARKPENSSSLERDAADLNHEADVEADRTG